MGTDRLGDISEQLRGEPWIRRATQQDLRATKALLDAVSQWLIAKGIYQWDQGYMPIETLKQRAERGELYICVSGEEVVGTLTLLDTDPELWGSDDGETVYLHTLAVRPDLRGTGLGRRMLEWIEQTARDRGRSTVRLDCLAQSEPLRRYYRQAGYEERGVKQLNATWRAALYEKRI